MVLGGHDHDYEHYVEKNEDGSQKGELFMVKSGTDFREFSEITLIPYSDAHIFNDTEFPYQIPCPSKGFTLDVKRI